MLIIKVEISNGTDYKIATAEIPEDKVNEDRLRRSLPEGYRLICWHLAT